MAIDRLGAPLRLTWDLHGRSNGHPAPATIAVAERVIEAGVFYVLFDQRPLAHAGFGPLLAELQGGGVRSSAIFTATAAEWDHLALARPLAGLFLDLDALVPAGDAALIATTVARLRDAGIDPALLLTPSHDNLPRLAYYLELAERLGIKRFKLPNCRVDASFTSADRERLPTPADIVALRRQLGSEAVALRSSLQLEIHDLFLWELFYPGERESGRAEYGGCQAANSLGHIAADGTVFPCSSWPLCLGTLPGDSLEEIWASPVVECLRDAVARVPDGCRGCRDYDLCLGGCRGLSATLLPGGDGRDLCCVARR